MVQLSAIKNICRIASSLVLSTHLLAAEHQIDVISSHRNEEQVAAYKKDVEDLTAIALKLGYTFSPVHQVTFVAAPELNQLATNGRYALPHWIDGGQLLAGMKRVSGVLEFVTQGAGIARSYYSDTSKASEQVSIIMHVLGHNDFAQNSGFARAKNNDTMAKSLELAQYLAELRRDIGADEVDLFIQQLYSMLNLQDFIGGSYEAPAEFVRTSLEVPQIQQLQQQARQRKEKPREAREEFSTPSVFSALVHQLPQDAPAWKKNVIKLFEEMVRHYSGNVATKIINEGWATFSQYLLYRHSPRHQDGTVDYGRLLFGVTYGKWKNPYWLGLECWKNVYKNFAHHNGGQFRDEMSRDQAFVAEAHQRINWQSSYAFIRESLDAQWVKDQRLFIYRKASYPEIQAACGDNYSCYPQHDEEAFITLSRNSERVVNLIAREQADHSLRYPQILLKQLNYQGSNGILLEHEIHHGFALDFPSMAKMLYLMASIYERPVSLKTLHYPAANAVQVGVKEALLVTVYPNQTVKVEAATPGTLQGDLERAIKAYEENISVGDSESERQSATPIYRSYIDAMFRPVRGMEEMEQSGSLVSHAPTTSSALLAYEDALNRRFGAMLRRALQGKAKVTPGKNSVKIQMLPEIPSFSFNRKVQKLILEALPPAPLDSRSSNPLFPYVFGQDDNAELDAHPSLMPGDIFKKKKPQPGSGQGEGDDEEGDPDEEGEAGEGGNDPSEVEIPLADWGRALQELLGLPNLRRTEGGKDNIITTKKKGVTKRDTGEIVWGRTIAKALGVPLSRQVIEGNDIDLTDIHGLLTEGIRNLAPRDYYVKARVENPRPKQRAVMVVVMDFSGSMQGVPHQIAAKLVFNLKALLTSQYPEVAFRFIMYDTKAHDMQEDDVFGKNPKFLGGGTSNVVGYQHAAEVLASYPYESWNKFLLGIGDAGAHDGPETVAILDKLHPEMQYTSFVYTNTGGWGSPSFVAALKDFAARKDWVKFAEINDPADASVLRVLKELFPPHH